MNIKLFKYFNVLQSGLFPKDNLHKQLLLLNILMQINQLRKKDGTLKKSIQIADLIKRFEIE